MRLNTYIVLSFMLVLSFMFSLASTGSAAEQTAMTVEGNVICLIPDYQKGTVTPVIATGPCANNPPHEHILVGKNNTVYYLQGLQEGLMKVAMNPNHTDVTITGKAEQTPGGWILYVN
jgi:hypothetical protein